MLIVMADHKIEYAIRCGVTTFTSTLRQVLGPKKEGWKLHKKRMPLMFVVVVI